MRFDRWLVLAALLGPMALAAADAVAQPAMYAVDFVSTAATGRAMNNQGMIAGVRLTVFPPGCTGSQCGSVPQAVVWSGDTVTPLPLLPGFSTVTPVSINASGTVAGYAGDPLTTGARAVVWKRTGTSYTAIDLGVIPGTTSSSAAGIDDQGRAVGWSTTGGAIPTATAPFVWSEAAGMVDLTDLGFPNEIPLAISPGGTVATPSSWYRLGDPSSVTPLAAPPAGFSGPGGYPAAINDSGDQARFQISTGTGFFPYLFRYDHAGTWQQIWFLPGTTLAPLGIGAINAAGDITATVGGAAVIAYGPDGLGQPLSAKLSPAYFPSSISDGGPINDSGQILAKVIIGRARRLVRLLAAEPCTTGCARVVSIRVTGRMIGFPPNQCTPRATNNVTATVSVTDEAGNALPRSTVTARFLDEYYLDEPVTGTTGLDNVVRFVHKGPACVGTTAILVEDVAGRGRVLDLTIGELTDSVIP